MTQRQLEIFTRLAETLNFTKTADQLFLSQTTVTLQIQNLEEELQVKLFDRTSRSVRLTYAGSVFYEGAREILNKITNTVEETQAAYRGYTGQLKIGFADEVNSTGISRFVREFSEQNPGIRMFVYGGYPEGLLDGLITDQYDLIFTPSFRRLHNRGLKSHLIGSYYSVAAFNKNHPFSRKQSLHFSDFEGENYIYISGSAEDLDFSSEFINYLHNSGIHVNITARIDNIDTVFFMLDSNMGVTVLPEYFAGRFSGTSDIRICPIEEKLKKTDFLAVWKSVSVNEERDAFVKFMKQYYTSSRPSQP